MVGRIFLLGAVPSLVFPACLHQKSVQTYHRYLSTYCYNINISMVKDGCFLSLYTMLSFNFLPNSDLQSTPFDISLVVKLTKKISLDSWWSNVD